MADEPQPQSQTSLIFPPTRLMAGAVQMHELFQAWVDAGFTRREAMELLKAASFPGGRR